MNIVLNPTKKHANFIGGLETVSDDYYDNMNPATGLVLQNITPNRHC